jgi:hypothetical protein
MGEQHDAAAGTDGLAVQRDDGPVERATAEPGEKRDTGRRGPRGIRRARDPEADEDPEGQASGWRSRWRWAGFRGSRGQGTETR